MLILTIRTDKPEAELGLYEDDHQLAYTTWEAHRALAETLHTKIVELLKEQQKDLADVRGIAVFKGPGSFTGLRIGLTVANALAYSLGIPIVSTTSNDWITKALVRLQNHETETVALPEYGREAHITTPRK